MEIKDFKTCELVKGLEKREGVETIVISPYEKKNLEIEGPVIVLKVID